MKRHSTESQLGQRLRFVLGKDFKEDVEYVLHPEGTQRRDPGLHHCGSFDFKGETFQIYSRTQPKPKKRRGLFS